MADKSLPNLIKDIVHFYVKHYYDKYLAENGITTMANSDIDTFIQRYYIEKETDLRKYIRDTLKKNQGAAYNQIAVENILLEMSNDPELAKSRIKLEIQDYQINNAK